jgi:hypothetical protein
MAPHRKVGRRKPSPGGLETAQGFLELVLKLRGNAPFIPKGLHKFKTFEEAQTWSLKMISRPKKS